MSYCISKAGIDQFTKCAALNLAAKGIRVNAINPGVIQTNIYNTLNATKLSADQFSDAQKSNSLVGRVGTVSNKSAGISYLATLNHLSMASHY